MRFGTYLKPVLEYYVSDKILLGKLQDDINILFFKWLEKEKLGLIRDNSITKGEK